MDSLEEKNSKWHISISSDGKYFLTINHETHEFNIYNEFNSDIPIKSYNFKEDFKNYQELQSTEYTIPKWILAISNCIDQIDQKFVFVAISCVTKFDMLAKESKKIETENLNNLLKEDNLLNSAKSFAIGIEDTNKDQENEGQKNNISKKSGITIIYKVTLNDDKTPSNIQYIYNISGVVTFIHKESTSNKILNCFIFNANGIYKLTCENNSKDDLKHFNYPRRFMIELNTLYETEPCTSQLINCVFDHYFYTVQYKEGIQVMQLYDLKTMQIQQNFNMHEEYSNVYGKPILAISKNRQMIAFSSGYRKLTLYLIENGLEIASKDFGKNVKIIDCQFKNSDSLMIIIKKSQKRYGDMLFWNLYDSSKNGFQHYNELDIDDKFSLHTAKIPDKLILVKDDGSILSVYDYILKKEKKKSNNLNHYKMPNEMNEFKYEDHKILYQGDQNISKAEQPFGHNKEPWINNDFERKSVYLNNHKSLQLYIGKSTIQVWHKKEEYLTLEYIWAHNVEEECRDNALEELDLRVSNNNNGFYLKVKWNKFIEEIQWPYDNNAIPTIHACNTLEYLHYQRNKLVGDNNQCVFEEIKYNISFIIWKFIKNYPDIWRLMDIRYNLMAKIIIGGSNALVKYILFGDEKVKYKNLHIPRITRWIDEEFNEISKESNDNSESNKSNSNIIDICKLNLERNRRILIVTYLLEYYAKNATNHLGWLITISKALTSLYSYKLEYYVRELFYKKCMEGIEISNIIEYSDIIPKKIQDTLNDNQKFQAFNPISELILKRNEKRKFQAFNSILKFILLKIFKIKIISSNYSPTVKMIPLHNFTTSKIPQKEDKGWLNKYILTIKLLFQLLFIPRSYLVSYSNDAKNLSQLSPLVQIIRLDNSNDIFDNPVMEAAINYKWPSARNYFLRLFFIYILFAICFAVICGTYTAHLEATGHLCNFLLFLIIIFYYLGCYLLVVELMQIRHRGLRHYLDFFNFVDLTSAIVAIVVMSVYIAPSFSTENTFSNVVTTKETAILYLRLFKEPAKYIYIILNNIKSTWVFLVFMFLVIVGLAHTFLLLLQYPDFINLSENSSNETIDNPAKDFITSFLSTYGWLSGNFLQQDTWNFWAVKLITLIASIFLVTILQNMFIAFMGGVYSEAYEKGRAALLRFRAELISDYEALDDIHFYTLPLEPKYIYYIGKSESYEEWETNVKKRQTDKEKLYDDYEKKMSERKLTHKENDDDNNDYNKDDNNKDHDNKDDKDDKDDDDDDDDESEDEDEDVIDKVKLLSNKVKEEFKFLKKEIEEVKSLKEDIKSLNSKIDQLLNNKNTN
ncbi:hypothetical protein RhiirC2_856762 [Rhizophagus irregularis]|uniref:Ion transport domain-containing protein n=1 Tax=Rhizophagus irregularis TaxID=588596 RepID=A0A2N1MG34_9GLOM|nr:hypothetical protein RhiirC2_856762 [Rhizophagus irregularis]